MSRRDDLVRRWRATSGRGRKLRGLLELRAALPRPHGADVRVADRVHRRGAGAAAARQAGDRRRDRARRPRHARPRRGRLHRVRARVLGRDLRADLPRRVDRPARAAGPPRPALRAPAVALGRLLLAPPGGRDHLAADERRAGARPTRLGRHRDAVRRVADPGRHGGDPARGSTGSSRCCASSSSPCSGSARSSSGSSAPTPTVRRARRSPRSRPTCRRRSRASGSCACSPRSAATSGSSPASTTRTAWRT